MLPRASRNARCKGLACAGAGRRQRTLANSTISCSPGIEREESNINDRGEHMNLTHHISRLETAHAAGAIGVAAFGKHRQHQAHGRRRRCGRRAPFALRGADSPRAPRRCIIISTHGTESYPESLTYFPEPRGVPLRAGSVSREHRHRRKKRWTFPSSRASTAQRFGGWTTFARQIEQAGADALELNIYSIPTDPELTAEEIETQLPHDSSRR